ncbi:hypothetical protein ACFL4O_03465 [bacterium]
MIKNKFIFYVLSLVFTCALILPAVFAKDISKHDVEIYGFLKLDTTYDDSIADNPDAARFASATDDAQFAMTAMNTRLGVKYSSPKTEGIKVSGLVEVDFYDTASVRMRHAYIELKRDKCSLLAGQTWDLFGILGPSTLNTNGYLWNGGNIGFRRPQLRLTHDYKEDIKVQVSINRNIGAATIGANSGENSGMPLMQARVSYCFPFAEKKTTVGLSGLYGSEKYNRWDGTSYDIKQTGVCLDVTAPINSMISLKGEFFSGSNLDALLAGIGQGVNTATEEGIGTTGAWAQLTYKPDDKHKVNVGYGMDNPDEDKLNNGNRQKNTVMFANIKYALVKDVKLGLEIANYNTEYVNTAKGTNNRITASVIYKLLTNIR